MNIGDEWWFCTRCAYFSIYKHVAINHAVCYVPRLMDGPLDQRTVQIKLLRYEGERRKWWGKRKPKYTVLETYTVSRNDRQWGTIG